nr:isopropylmalate synthase [uncultured Caproiciproducens sp.]
MIRITDKTLSCLDDYDATPRQLRTLCGLLLTLGVDFTELSVDAYRKIGFLPENGKYILKVEDVIEARKYPGFDRYICRHSGLVTPVEVVTEIQVNDINEIYLLKQYQNLASVRITGLDDILCHDYNAAFQQIKKNISGKIEICPENRYFCATAIAVEWILSGGKNLAASFAGIGDFAPLEEVLMALRLELRYKPNMDYSIYPQIKTLFEQITGKIIPAHKSIIGSNIFDVEAGVHADGILKDPNIYEPFKPELVGDKRCLVMGKHSGKTAVIMKLNELGIKENETDIPAILDAVRQKSIEKQSSLTDEDFIELIKAM